MKKSEFKAIVKQCVKECLREVIEEQIDPKLTKALLAGVVIGNQQNNVQQNKQLPTHMSMLPQQSRPRIQDAIQENDLSSTSGGTDYINPADRLVWAQPMHPRTQSMLDVPVQRHMTNHNIMSDSAITRSSMSIDSNIMNDIMQDTAQTTLLEQAQAGHTGPSSARDGGGQIDASLADPYAAKLANSNLESHFSNVDRWASLAFSKK